MWGTDMTADAARGRPAVMAECIGPRPSVASAKVSALGPIGDGVAMGRTTARTPRRSRARSPSRAKRGAVSSVRENCVGAGRRPPPLQRTSGRRSTTIESSPSATRFRRLGWTARRSDYRAVHGGWRMARRQVSPRTSELKCRSPNPSLNRCRPSRCSGNCSSPWVWRAQGCGSRIGAPKEIRRADGPP